MNRIRSKNILEKTGDAAFDPPKSPLKRGTLHSDSPFLRGLGGSKVSSSAVDTYIDTYLDTAA